MSVLFEYPVPLERAFHLKLPTGSQLVGVFDDGALDNFAHIYGKAFVIAVTVDPNEKSRELWTFHKVTFGEPVGPRWEFVGKIDRGVYIYVEVDKPAIEAEPPKAQAAETSVVDRVLATQVLRAAFGRPHHAAASVLQ